MIWWTQMFLFYFWIKHNHAKSLRLWLTLCDPMACSLPGSSVHGILQARILKWIAVPASRASSWPRDGTHASSISYIGRWILYHLGKSLSMLLQMTEFPFFLMAEWYSTVCVCYPLCIYVYICVCVCVCVCVYIFIFCIHLSTERHSDSSRILVSFLFLGSHSYLV